MSTHQRVLVMLSLLALLSNVSTNEDTLYENDAKFEELNDDTAENLLLNTNDETNSLYPENTKDVLFLQNDPELFFVPSTNRKRNNMRLGNSNKRMNIPNYSMKDENKIAGKPSLSILSPLEALQRKVAVVYNTRQKEKNRGLLNNYGKRSSLDGLVPEQSDLVLTLENDQLKQISCCPHFQRRKFYGLYRVP